MCKRSLTHRKHTETTSIAGLEDLNVELPATANNTVGAVHGARTEIIALVDFIAGGFQELISEKSLAITGGIVSIFELRIYDIVRVEIAEALAIQRAILVLLALTAGEETIVCQASLDILSHDGFVDESKVEGDPLLVDIIRNGHGVTAWLLCNGERAELAEMAFAFLFLVLRIALLMVPEM